MGSEEHQQPAARNQSLLRAADDATKSDIVAANSSSRHRDIKVNGHYRSLTLGAARISLIHVQLMTVGR